MEFKLLENAIFIGDCHENKNKHFFFNFLKFLDEKNPKIPQIFLMGDIFDFLTNTDFVKKFYEKEIGLLNKLSKKYEIYYLEGNHDFNLSKIFKNIKVFKNSAQPVFFTDEFNHKIALAHGDIFLPFFTQKILLFLRNKVFLNIMNLIDKILYYKISKAILKSQENKILYKKFINFDKYIEKKLLNYNADYVIEGHYHQDVFFKFEKKNYFNLNSFAVEPKAYKVKFENKNLILKPFEYNYKNFIKENNDKTLCV
ncbi:UDP-2,3-diacylglucosamine diphosphatase [Campylobacter ureolyticus]|uniref:UDP-2,3-diacylglucosamine diphosphatase n=1 Tax=Campylobacter ureolyticus TaxID=827 RepID=UPI0022B42D94|nr:UDP-2,3-diacylglucosamine diphosphatase [Campylobacter ureolyticus]MCZ6156409.1 UDP-2,3-diacylglucosamine diphosphatase [Campylobacter ureolyticus]